jgi:sugar phosphate isomerase/epimerase
VQGGVGAPINEQSVAALRATGDVLASVGAKLAVEFLPFIPVNSIAATRTLLEQANIRGAAIVVDTWHFFHGPDDWADLEGLGLDELAYVQFNDHPKLESGDLLHETMHRRVMPGEGTFDLTRFCSVIQSKGYDGVVSVEVLGAEFRTWDLNDFARRAYETSASFWT